MNRLNGNSGKTSYDEMMVDGLNYSYVNRITSYVQKLGHNYVERRRRALSLSRCLELGCGNGEFLEVFKGANYVGIDKSKEAIDVAKERNPEKRFIVGDIRALPFKDGEFDCLIANYIFEHVKELDLVFQSIKRVVDARGRLLVSLPTEGGMAWAVGRHLTSKRYMEKKFNIDYLELIRREHVNSCDQVIRALQKHFTICHRSYMPFYIPSIHLNAIVGLECKK